MIKYCVKCGEALRGATSGGDSVFFRTQHDGDNWLCRLSYCPQESCPRFGLLTWKVEPKLEDAQKLRDQFKAEKDK